MKKIVLIITVFLNLNSAFAQEPTRVITTATPFLLIATDARSAAMADMGVATSADTYSMMYNPAKFAFLEDQQGVGLSYTPYLSSIANDISLAQLSYSNRFNERSAFAVNLRYFGLGDIQLSDEFGNNGAVVNPNEFTLEGAYALKLSERFSMGVGGKLISSNLKINDGTNDASAASTFAVDVSAFYQSEEIYFNDFNGRFRAGVNFQNMGPKISYDNDVLNENFIPANMRLGAGFDFLLDDYNKVTVTGEVTKLLVPTPQDFNNDGVIDSQDANTYRQIGWVDGIFKSFNDAPDGISEELKETTWALGAEYWYQDSFALRTGYFHEAETKGARKYFTLGAGFKYNVIKIDVSYLFSASQVRNPLENTLRFSLSFSLGDKYDEL